jgi:two-component sensor histidine kinase
LRSSSSAGEAFERIQARLMALSNTHNLLHASSCTGAPLREILAAELGPYRGGHDGRVVLDGPPLDLDARSALALGLIVHELATNAAKYGALSAPDGRVSVTWRTEGAASGRTVHLAWREAGGPPVTTPGRRGFGTRLIERSAADLGGAASLDFLPAGMSVDLTFPVQTGASAAAA